jgi:hypothetical protein
MKTKRPILIWLIAPWLFLQHFAFLSYPLDRFARLSGIPREAMRQWKGGGVLLVIVLCVLLLQMRNKARFAAAACFTLAVYMLGRLILLLVLAGTVTPSRMLALMVVSLVLNPFVIWFLLRPSYGRRCDSFRAERDIAKQKKAGTYINLDEIESIGE